MNRCVFVYPYFDNPQMLDHQVDNWNAFPEEVRRNLALVLVDDHSARPAWPILARCTLRKILLRFTQPGLWTMHEARNLGAFFTMERRVADWLFLSDIDLVVTPETAVTLLSKRWNPRHHYSFSRAWAPAATPGKPHPNSFLVERRAFAAINGYDVDFCGLYGGGYGGDYEFARQLSTVSKHVHCPDVVLMGYSRDVIPDANTTTWDRKEWYSKYLQVLNRKKEDGNLRSVHPVRRTWEVQYSDYSATQP